MMIRSRALCCFLLLLWQPAFGAGEVVLDSGFGTGGLVLPVFPGQPSIDSAGEGRCVAVQEDGKILLAGQSLAGGLRRIAVLRFLADGQPDTSFGNQGVALLASPYGDDQASALRLHDNGILVAGRTSNGGTSDMLLVRLHADGSPDTNFGTGGRVEVDFDGADDAAFAVTSDSLDRWVVAGMATQNGTSSAALLRLLADGSPDPSFGDSGRAVSNILGINASEGRGVVVQTSGRIIIGGHARISTTDHFALLAFTSTGATDPGFGTDGYALTSIGTGTNVQSRAQSLIELAGGQLLLAGTGTLNGSPRAALARYSASGSLDTSFGSAGTVLSSAGAGETSARDVVQQADGSLLVAATLNGATMRFATLKFTSAGSLDTSFGSSGVSLTAFSGYNAECAAMATATGGFILAGTLGGELVSSLGLARYTTPGSLSGSFSTDGRLEVNLRLTAPFAQARAVLQQTDGKIVLAGSVTTDNGTDFVVCRYLADASPDPAFGTQGRVIHAIGPEDDVAYRMLLQSDGKILVAGTSQEGGLEKACLIRLLSNGSLDPDFGSGGLFLDQTGGAGCGIYTLALQADGKIVAAGYMYNGTATVLQCALWRLTPSGALDTSFSADGRQVAYVTAANRDTYANAIAVQADGKIVTAGPAFTDAGLTQASFGLLRFQTTGVLDTSFGVAGRRAIAPIGYAAQAQGLALQADGALVVAGFAEAGGVGGDSRFAAVRLLATGALDNSYGTSGWTLADFPGFADQAYDLLLDGEGRALLTGTTYTTSSRIALLRLTPTGATDADFGTTGQVVLATNSGDHQAYGASLAAGNRLLLAGAASSSFMGARIQLPSNANRVPVATPDTWSVLPGSIVTLDVLANDTDPDNDSLSLESWTAPPAGGTVTRIGSLLQFTAAAHFTGASFTYTISDGNGAVDTTTVTLTPVATFAAWQIAWFGEDADDPVIAAPEADADNDGVDNLTEYALGGNPLQATSASTPGRDNSGRLTLTYQIWVAAQDIAVTPVFCTDLASWGGGGVLLEVLNDDGIRRTLRATAPDSLPLQAQFGRLHIDPR